MELKQAGVICLIALFAASLVVLIARVLDMQAASRLEPHLARIADELEAIRKQGGGLAPASTGMAESNATDDGLIVYYFHGKVRCRTCRSIESQSHETVTSDFASELDSGEMIWKIVDYEAPGSETMVEEFGVTIPVVVLVRMTGGEIAQHKRLDMVWALVGDKPAFAEYVRGEIRRMLEAGEEAPVEKGVETPTNDAPSIPIPE